MAKLFTAFLSFVAGVVVAAAIAFYSLPGLMIKEIPSPYSFEETMEKIEVNAKAEGWKVPKKWKIDFQKNLKYVTKVDIGPNKLLKMCEPQAAVDILIHDELKRLSVMMPCTIGVYEKSDGKTYITIMNMKILGLLFGDVVDEITAELAPQMEKMVTLKPAD
ncbi:MAG: DUF302 domain-containing protein [Proteobacteria bacterium]|nr:DUF302 domain-containing protein [Pseudomonadota bacterium]